MSDSVQPHRWQPTRLPCPWDSPGEDTGVGCHFLFQNMKVKSYSEFTQSCTTLSDPMDCSLPGSSVHGIFQARALEWGAIAFCLRTAKVLLMTQNVIFHGECPERHGEREPERNIYFAVIRWRILQMSIKSSLLAVLLKSTVSLLIFCLLDISISESKVLKFPKIVVNFSIYHFNSVSFCLITLMLLLLGA